MTHAITFVTSNKHKVALFRLHAEGLGVEIVHADLPLVEPQAETIAAVAASKAAQAFEKLRAPLIVEDTGFVVDGLRGFPGPYSKYILQTIGVQGLIALARSLAPTDRGCGFINAMVYVDAAGTQHTFVDDSGRGRLADAVDETVCADAVSDLWKIFIPEGATTTLNALSADERKALWRIWERSSVSTRCAQWVASHAE